MHGPRQLRPALTAVQQVPQVGQGAGQPQLLCLPQRLHACKFGSVNRRAGARLLSPCGCRRNAWRARASRRVARSASSRSQHRCAFPNAQQRLPVALAKTNMSAAPQQQQQQQQPARRMLATVEIQQVHCSWAQVACPQQWRRSHRRRRRRCCNPSQPVSTCVAWISCLQMLDENARLIAAIVENQNLGKLNECIE